MTCAVVLGAKGKVEEAIAEYREAIRLKNDYAEAHCNLGSALRRQGRLAESLEALRRGHALGSKRPGWPYPSLSWLRQAEQLVQQEKGLLDVLSGKRQPASPAERIKYTSLCTLTRRYEAAARLYADAFAADSTLANDLQAGHRYNAARSAALAAVGKNAVGKNADSLTAMERLALRRQALTWLRANLALWTRRQANGKPGDGATVQQTMRHWQQDSDLAALRDPAALAKLSVEERQACEKFWADVALLKSAKPNNK
jgi:tetratricopeptide (TPR) repeat protein